MKQILILLSVLFFTAFTADNILILQNGFSNFVLGKTSLTIVHKRYPDQRRLFYDNIESVLIPEQGIELFFHHQYNENPDSIFISQIDIISPCFARTEKNIRIGSSSEEVVKKYGMKKDYKESTLLVYDGISFYLENGKVNRISLHKNY